MSEQGGKQTESSSSSSSSSKQTKQDKAAKRGPGLAAIQGENAKDDRPAERQPGTPEHLGSDRPYEGDESPFVEGDEAAQNR